MKIDETVWTQLQRRLGYSDDEMIEFKKDPKNEAVLSKVPELFSKTIVAEVKQAHGCNSGHKVGEKFYFDGSGNLLTKLCPSRMCIYALSALQPLVFAVHELIYAGADPNKMIFKRCGCIDIGLECGGWGKVIMEVSVQDRGETTKMP
jgi:uncharacterized repeat protein (TIGR04076 family)